MVLLGVMTPDGCLAAWAVVSPARTEVVEVVVEMFAVRNVCRQ